MVTGFGLVQSFFGLSGQGVHGQAGFGHDHASRESDGRVVGHVGFELGRHPGGEPLGAVPGANQKKVVTAGEHGVGVGELCCTQGWQIHREECVHLP